jgi:type VI protein secretion system component Hcp
MTTFTTQDRQAYERPTLRDELTNLVKNHIKHSLCGGPVSYQSRVYLDGVEISSIRQEKPKAKPLTKEEIADLQYKHIEIEWFDEGEYGMEHNIYGVEEFARAIERAHGIGEQK